MLLLLLRRMLCLLPCGWKGDGIALFKEAPLNMLGSSGRRCSTSSLFLFNVGNIRVLCATAASRGILAMRQLLLTWIC
jgi:hypothetical protein